MATDLHARIKLSQSLVQTFFHKSVHVSDIPWRTRIEARLNFLAQTREPQRPFFLFFGHGGKRGAVYLARVVELAASDRFLDEAIQLRSQVDILRRHEL